MKRLLVLVALLLLGSSSAAFADVSVSVGESISPSTATPGGSVTVSFSATNNGSTEQAPFSVVLFLGQHWTVGAAPAGCSRPDPYDIDCELGSLAAGASTPSFSVTATVDADAQPGWILDSRVIAFPGGTSGAGLGSDSKSIQVSAPTGGGGGGGSTPPPPPPPPAPPTTLSVALHGAGSGSVTSAPAGIDCGAVCAAAFSGGTAVTLTATAASGSTFGGWGDGCAAAGTNAQCTVTLTASTAISASFDLAPTPVPPPAPPPVVCKVPALHGLTLAAAKVQLTRSHCRLGHVTQRVARASLAGRVLSQQPGAGGRLPDEGRVTIVLGRRR